MWRKSRLLLNEVIEVIGFVLHDPFIPPLANVTDLNPFIQCRSRESGTMLFIFPISMCKKHHCKMVKAPQERWLMVPSIFLYYCTKIPYILWEKRHKRP